MAELRIELQRAKEQKAKGETDQLKEIRLGYEKEIEEMRNVLQRELEVNKDNSKKISALRVDHKALRVHFQDEVGEFVYLL
jgi:hypothetical protein